ncbi:protein of unknown function [Magnetospirillum sp. XM-1]|uniref:transposase n=1 Tax=Magnetospirillum sp. XM-1 TaxID=1663591 RepID=UPI00073DEB90|nr:transposase [Magnetospirillum sp. XM-1]CUW39372.1 protein of unknown function [Magnetospirillum sp. XM-1]
MKVEVLAGVEHRRRWHWEEKTRLVEETLAPGATVAEVARRHGVAPSLLFYWRRQARDGLCLSTGCRRRCWSLWRSPTPRRRWRLPPTVRPSGAG